MNAHFELAKKLSDAATTGENPLTVKEEEAKRVKLEVEVDTMLLKSMSETLREDREQLRVKSDEFKKLYGP